MWTWNVLSHFLWMLHSLILIIAQTDAGSTKSWGQKFNVPRSEEFFTKQSNFIGVNEVVSHLMQPCFLLGDKKQTHFMAKICMCDSNKEAAE